MTSLFCIWAGAGVVGAAVLAVELELLPRPGGALAWLRRHAGLRGA